MRILPGSKTPIILQLYADGVSPPNIAKAVSVDRTYVYRVLHRHGRFRGFRPMAISRVSDEDIDWLRHEAERLGATVADLARAMLTDAIYEARHGKN